jgi:hypothetical protein
MLTPQPVTPPKAPLEKNETALMKQGISLLAFNADGTLCATRDDSTPSTVWIWDLKSLKPRTILIQYAPVKALLWHPHDPSRLLVQANHDAPAVYLYTATPHLSASRSSSSSVSQSPPAILDLETHITTPRSANSASARWSLHWLAPSISKELKKPIFVFGHQQGHVIVWPEGKDQILRFEREDEEGESDDSLYDILTGRTPVPRIRDDVDMEEGIDDEEEHTGEGLDDTFREKRRGNGASSAGMSLDRRGSERGGLDDSGLDEMF